MDSGLLCYGCVIVPMVSAFFAGLDGLVFLAFINLLARKEKHARSDLMLYIMGF